MTFASIAPEVKQKILDLHSAGIGRNEIHRRLQRENIKASPAFITSLIQKHERNQSLKNMLQPQSQEQSSSIINQQTPLPHYQSSCKNHVNNIHSNALEVEQDNSSIQTHINKIGSPSVKPGDGGPLLSHLPVEDFIEDKDNPNPPQTKTKSPEVNINNNGKCLHNQDETIEEEKQYQHRTLLSNIKNTSRRSENNRGKEDQDQEESIDNDSGVKEPADQRVEPKIFLESDLGNGKVAVSALAPEDGHGYSRSHNLDLEPKNYNHKKAAEDYRQSRKLLNYDIDENWQTRFWKRALQEKEEQQRRLRLIQHHQGLLEKQRQGLLELKQSLDKQTADIKAQQVELKEIEPLIPQLRRLKDVGVDFSLLMQIVATLNEVAVFQNLDLKTAAYNVGQMIRGCQDLGGVNREIERAQERLSALDTLIAQKQQRLTVADNRNLNNNGYSGGLSTAISSSWQFPNFNYLSF